MEGRHWRQMCTAKDNISINETWQTMSFKQISLWLTARLCPSTENAMLDPEATETFCVDSMYGQLEDAVTV